MYSFSHHHAIVGQCNILHFYIVIMIEANCLLKKRSAMKKQFVSIVLIAVLSYLPAAAAPVTPTNKDNTVQVVLAASFHRMVVCNNVNVVLVEEASQQVSVKGKAKWCEAVKLEVKDGVLTVSSSRSSSMKQATVYIPVQQLESITVKGYSDIESKGALHSHTLNIYIEGDCRVSVLNDGLVTVSNGPLHDFEYEVKKKISL